MSPQDLDAALQELLSASQEFNCSRVVEILSAAPTGFTPNEGVSDLVWQSEAQKPGVEIPESDKVRRFPV